MWSVIVQYHHREEVYGEVLVKAEGDELIFGWKLWEWIDGTDTNHSQLEGRVKFH